MNQNISGLTTGPQFQQQQQYLYPPENRQFHQNTNYPFNSNQQYCKLSFIILAIFYQFIIMLQQQQNSANQYANQHQLNLQQNPSLNNQPSTACHSNNRTFNSQQFQNYDNQQHQMQAQKHNSQRIQNYNGNASPLSISQVNPQILAGDMNNSCPTTIGRQQNQTNKINQQQNESDRKIVYQEGKAKPYSSDLPIRKAIPQQNDNIFKYQNQNQQCQVNQQNQQKSLRQNQIQYQSSQSEPISITGQPEQLAQFLKALALSQSSEQINQYPQPAARKNNEQHKVFNNFQQQHSFNHNYHAYDSTMANYDQQSLEQQNYFGQNHQFQHSHTQEHQIENNIHLIDNNDYINVQELISPIYILLLFLKHDTDYFQMQQDKLNNQKPDSRKVSFQDDHHNNNQQNYQHYNTSQRQRNLPQIQTEFIQQQHKQPMVQSIDKDSQTLNQVYDQTYLNTCVATQEARLTEIFNQITNQNTQHSTDNLSLLRHLINKIQPQGNDDNGQSTQFYDKVKDAIYKTKINQRITYIQIFKLGKFPQSNRLFKIIKNK